MKSQKLSFVFAGFFLLYNIVGSALLGTLRGMLPFSLPPYLFSLIFYCIIFILPVFLFLRSCQIPLSEIGLRRKPTPRQILLAVLLALICQPFLMLISSLSAMLFHDYVADSLTVYTQYPFVLILFSSALLPAFCEELACRGIFLYGLRQKAPWYAALLSGLLFGILHLNPQQFAYAFLFGFGISWVYLATDCLWLTILIHFLINGTQLALAFFTPAASEALASGGMFIPRGIISLLFSILIIVRLYYEAKHPKTK